MPVFHCDTFYMLIFRILFCTPTIISMDVDFSFSGHTIFFRGLLIAANIADRNFVIILSSLALHSVVIV